MYEKEKKQHKYFFCVVFGFSALSFCVIGGLHASRSVNAGRINDDYKDKSITDILGANSVNIESG